MVRANNHNTKTPMAQESSSMNLREEVSLQSDSDHRLEALRYKVVLATMDEGIHIVDERGRTVFYNIAMARLEGLHPSEVLGRTITEVFPKLTPETSTLLRVLRTKQAIYDNVQTYHTYYGNTITTVNSTIPIIIDGECVGAVEIAKDVARIHHLAKSLQELSESNSTFPTEKIPTGNGTVYTFERMIGTSAAFLKAKKLAQKAAGNDGPVLLYGETGVGKEVFAQSIHNASKRASREFIAVNCAALPESLLESTLYGTVRGAFTGATDHPGLFEQASGGTLLLDELNSTSPNFQSKLLRAIEEKAVRRIGSTKLTPVDTRIIATLGVDPLEAVEQNMLRKDLYFRLAVNVIKIPPLRERKEDIILLANMFATLYSSALERPVPTFEKAVEEVFQRYHWPGNVRELKNVIQSTIELCERKDFIGIDDLPEHFKLALERTTKTVVCKDNSSLKTAVELMEYNMIRSALYDSSGNITVAARSLGITRQALQYKMRKYKLEREYRSR